MTYTLDTDNGDRYINGVGAVETAPWKGPLVKTVTVDAAITSICDGAFSGYTNLTSVQLGTTGVTSLGERMFYNCTALTQADLGSSLTAVPDHGFQNCTALESIVLPDTVTTIGDEAFMSCTKLAEVTLNEGLTSIGTQGFFECKSLKTLSLPASLTTLAPWTPLPTATPWNGPTWTRGTRRFTAIPGGASTP